MQLASGMLLVATPALQDPNFVDTVVLLLDVNDEGALGVVLNRPSQVLVADVLEPWREVVAEPEVLFRGGPVGTDGALAVARLRDPTTRPSAGGRSPGCSGWSTSTPRPSSSTARSARCGSSPATPAGAPTSSRARSTRAAGTSSPREAGDAFRGDTSGLRRDVMRRQPGMLAWHATRPVDPDLN